jgi:hypothetical protein
MMSGRKIAGKPNEVSKEVMPEKVWLTAHEDAKEPREEVDAHDAPRAIGLFQVATQTHEHRHIHPYTIQSTQVS